MHKFLKLYNDVRTNNVSIFCFNKFYKKSFLPLHIIDQGKLNII